MMNLEPGLMIWTIISFLIFLILLWKFAWTPILKALDAREKGIQNDIDSAKTAREEAKSALAEYRKQLTDAQSDVQAILSKARQDAERVREDLLAKSKQEAEMQIERARKQIDLERQEAVTQIRAEVAGLVISSAEKVIGKSLDIADHERLIMDSLKGES